MKLTNLHIFLIILLALVLCSTLGGTCSREGYGTDNQTYHTYKNFYKDLDNETTGGVSDNTKNTKHHKPHHRHHQGRHYRQHHDRENYKNDNGYGYGNGDLNVGDYSDPSGMYSDSSKRSHYKHTDYNSAYRRERQNDNMFDSVSNGAINGSIFNSSNSYSTNDDYDNSNGNDDDYGNGDGNGNGNGVSSDQIPPGQEDLYIRKTQMVPPICPACPKCPSVNCDDKCGNNKCPPCPACARCPEPQFECKKVPNYSSANIMGNLPIPWADKLDLH